MRTSQAKAVKPKAGQVKQKTTMNRLNREKTQAGGTKQAKQRLNEQAHEVQSQLTECGLETSCEWIVARQWNGSSDRGKYQGGTDDEVEVGCGRECRGLRRKVRPHGLTWPAACETKADGGEKEPSGKVIVLWNEVTNATWWKVGGAGGKAPVCVR